MNMLAIDLLREEDIVMARAGARDIAARLGFDTSGQVRVATAVSELARHGVAAGARSTMEFAVEGASAPQLLVIRMARHIEASAATGRSRNGNGAAIPADLARASRLMDRFDVSGSAAGELIVMKQVFPRGAPFRHDAELAALKGSIDAAGRRGPPGLPEELKQLNRELAGALAQLEDRQQELSRLNAELFDTNRGVLALYAELDERAEHLRQADRLKTRFLSNMSHEFRTPLNSILALTRLLEERVDGELTPEQERQLGYIRKSALELLELVNDLLDLAKVEAGKIPVRPSEFGVESLFAALRGMLRPLLGSQPVALHFDDAGAMPLLYTDEAKVAQILRNFLANALKFTERGEIRVSTCVRATAAGERAVLCVRDTGIGIARADQERIFEEFVQIEGPLQQRTRGTGLGLPLCRRLAHLLGGEVWVESEPGAGSCFCLSIPVRYTEPASAAPASGESPAAQPQGLVAVVLDERTEDRALIEAALRDMPFTPIGTDRVDRARELFAREDPALVLLDVALRGDDAWRFLPEIKRAGVPAVVVSGCGEQAKARSLGADEWVEKPIDRDRLCDAVRRAVLGARLERILLVDDDPTFVALLKAMLSPCCRRITEASGGTQALERLAEEGVDLLVSDLLMPAMSGIELAQRVRRLAGGAVLPILLCTSHQPDSAQRDTLRSLDVALLSKSDLSREALLDMILGMLATRPNPAPVLADEGVR